ncbi:MAG: hypothetical protein FWG92_07545 [Leptospirales bacterium]|nr:hypothetical protein [Leptospirales bacterium]
MKILKNFFFMACLFALCFSCTTGSKGTIKLANVDAPMSMSPYLYGPRGENVSIDKGLEYLGSFLFVKNYYGIIAGLVPLSNDKKINENIQNKIRELNGDGVVNLHFVVTNNNTANNCNIFLYIPFWPGVTEVKVGGDVVKYTGAKK